MKEPEPGLSATDDPATEQGRGTSSDYIRPSIRLEEYECSIAQHAVTFTQLVQAYHGKRISSADGIVGKDTWAEVRKL